VTDYEQHLTPDATVIYPGRGKLLLLVLGCVAAILISGFIWTNGEETVYRIAGLAGVVFCGCASIYFLLRLTRPKPSLLINESGMVDNASALSGGFVRWDEIESISISLVGRQQFLAVNLKDPQEFLSRQPSTKAALMRMNMGLAGTPICIPRSTLPMTLEELMEAIQQKHPGIPVT
jgi:hypothetical protein